MRRITAHLFSSADGNVESPNLFQFDSFDDECGQAMGVALATADTTILGRVLYGEWSDYFPKAADPFADWINPTTKYVASRTLTGPLEWQNSQLIEGDFLDFVRDLKQGDGGDIAVNGITVIRELVAADLVDALTLTVHPVLAGDGRRLFDGTVTPQRLQLIDSQITSKGNALLTYGPRSS